jgi:hypothetical protein
MLIDLSTAILAGNQSLSIPLKSPTLLFLFPILISAPNRADRNRQTESAHYFLMCFAAVCTP